MALLLPECPIVDAPALSEGDVPSAAIIDQPVSDYEGMVRHMFSLRLTVPAAKSICGCSFRVLGWCCGFVVFVFASVLLFRDIQSFAHLPALQQLEIR